jgi:Fuc2NAc and GlcNAc transferase
VIPVTLTCLILFGSLLSWAVTGWFRNFALEQEILDLPNHRSSHSVPTPRGGGVSFVCVFALGVFALAISKTISYGVAMALVGALPVAAVGYWDDLKSISPALRVSVHLAAALWAVAWLGGMHSAGFGSLAGGWIFTGVMTVGLVWLINLTNFMDGIDGLAGVEAITTAAACSVLVVSKAGFNGVALLFALLAASVAGFLLWNWPPARIFMGDIGSGFLGFALGVMALIACERGWLSLWSVLILPGVFLIDSTWTLGNRVLRGERWYAPHRTHAYQYAASRWGHRNTTLAIAGINLFWLVPFSFLANRWPSQGIVFLVAAWSPLLWLAASLHARAVELSQL